MPACFSPKIFWTMTFLLLSAWTMSEWLAMFTLCALVVIPVVAMWRFFVKGADEKKVP